MSRLDPTRAIVCACGALAASAALAAGPAQQTPVFRAGIDLVNVPVTVTDRKGNLIADLRAEDFEILEDGRKQAIQYFSAGLNTGPGGPHMHLGLLLDVSESM